MKATLPSLLAALLAALPLASAQVPAPHPFPEHSYPITEFMRGLRLGGGQYLNDFLLWDYEFDLNNCLANYEGVLHWVTNGGGGYNGSCTTCQLDGDTVMTCYCSVNDQGKGQSASIDLKNCRYIWWENAELHCGDRGEECANHKA
ncbi:hypothetical protein F4821DRAFT_255543 [Hypoxylon rubiginosum]|uniref:Uncharacterized protein n=1 Tax=Hypoxylon rubiginosum TaxID=110542 RepID=A0ACC0DDM9_9PEZI|nr:hypothetical protein F4821DRAFT_255543 [Hypoxylon rubiginosum]